MTEQINDTSTIISRDWENESIQKLSVPHSRSTIIGIVLLMIVLIATGFLYARVASLESERSDLIASIANEQTAIDQLKAKPELRKAELLRANKSNLSNAIDASNAATYIRELERIQTEDPNLILNGFSFVPGKIITSAVSLKGTYDDAAKRIIPFIRGYRDGSANSASGSLAKFDLKQIQNIGGKSDKRSINLEFNIQ
jgi:hypothetical protein